ncbi:MAG: saccharopine dehydrogenase NADP-binding domain-containing protein [Chloroflexi bacterium]|nr:saccharopine dehydrogenase NADP-binding domain-containing protein [Chloroflexota bacterium]
MRVLLIGVGTVGEAIARLSYGRPWLELMVLADYDRDRARRIQSVIGADAATHPAAAIDASDERAVEALARAHRVDLVLNAVDPRFVMPIFDGALAAGVDYMDMAMSLSRPDPDEPYRRPGVKLGDRQFERAGTWQERGRLALVGMGMDPGLSDVFAAHAARHLFDEIHAVHIRDGGDLRVEGHAFAPVFSIWTTIEECLNPPIVWQRDSAWTTREPFAEPERFTFPEGVGPMECVHVEHEEVVLVPRWLDVTDVTFKYALGDEFIQILRTLHRLGLDRTDPVRVKDVDVAPRDLVAALTPDPATLGAEMVGRAIVGSWVTGLRDGQPREVYLYQACDAQETMRQHGLQPVAWQTGFNPVLAMELLAEGAWSGAGILGPEAFDPDPYLALLDHYGIHHAMMEIRPGTAVAE